MGRNAQMTPPLAFRGDAPDRPYPRATAPDLWAEAAVDAATFSALRRRVVLEGCKWDPQVGDVDTLSPFPLVLKSSVWNQLASQAELLTAEAIAAEEEIS